MVIAKNNILTFVFCLFTLCSVAQSITPDTIAIQSKFPETKRKPIFALSEIIGLNTSVWAVDKFILNKDFAYIDHKTIYTNFEKGPVWDSDLFGTNFILHPYHGSLYYNAARSNSFNFYESIPFAFTGSLTWEYLFETERPSINDLISTTIGGTALGEVTYRLSNQIFDNSAYGANRLFREIFGTIISPISGLNRIISGKAWKHSNTQIKEKIPINFSLYTGYQVLKPRMNADYLPYLQFALNLEYNPNLTEIEKPYDWFELYACANIRPNTIYIKQLNLTGLLWNKTIKESNHYSLNWGIYQHISYLDSPIKEYQETPYRMVQIAAIGPGLHYHKQLAPAVKLDTKVFLTAIGLGASLSDHYWIVDRDYSFGSGFSTGLQFNIIDEANGFKFKFSANNYQLFTWKGYDPKRKLYNENLQMLNAQGDEGSVNVTTIETELGYQSPLGWNVSVIPSYLLRSNHYKYFPSVNYSTYEFSFKIGYKI